MPVHGDPARIGALAQRLQRVVGVPQKTAIRFAPELRGMLQQEFASGTDPFGDPWKGLKPITIRKGRTPPPLTASGRARNAVNVTASGARDRASMVNYLRYHLATGRAVLPLRGQVWPEKWVEAIRNAGRAALAEIAKGAVR